MIKEKIIKKKDGTYTKIVVLSWKGLDIVLRPTDTTAWMFYNDWVKSTCTVDLVQGGDVND